MAAVVKVPRSMRPTSAGRSSKSTCAVTSRVVPSEKVPTTVKRCVTAAAGDASRVTSAGLIASERRLSSDPTPTAASSAELPRLPEHPAEASRAASTERRRITMRVDVPTRR
jgi:hypothetical protein